MRTIGLIGGMSWESTRLYYAAINEEVRRREGGLHSADMMIHSVDFAPIAEMQAAGQWDMAGDCLVESAKRLARAGAECIAVATNTMHKLAPRISEAVPLPFIHIADATCNALIAAGRRRPFLMATRFTMEQDFYTGVLRSRGLDVQIPSETDRETIHRIIYDELCQGAIRDTSRDAYVQITERAAAQDADCIILGCTEVGLLLSDANAALPTFDTTLIHARALADFALGSPSSAASTT
ncbi:MAG: aspartate/glutamate racemase family protein [Pseudomonadota bacterium]